MRDFGGAQIFFGPLSGRFRRKPILMADSASSALRRALGSCSGRGGMAAVKLARSGQKLAFHDETGRSWRAQRAVHPPSTLIVVPVIWSAAGEQRKTTLPPICSTVANCFDG